MKKMLLVRRLLMLLIISLLATACQPNDYPAPNLSGSSIPTKLLFAHFAPDTNQISKPVALTWHYENVPINTQLTYNQYINGYREFGGGTSRQLRLLTAADNKSRAVSNSSLLAGRNYSVYAIDSAQKPGLFIIGDTLNTDNTKAGIRLIHLSPGLRDTVILTIDDVNVFDNKSLNKYKTFSGGKFTAIAPVIDKTLILKKKDTGEALYTLQGVTMNAGKNYSVIIRGFKDRRDDRSLALTIIPH